MWTVIHRAGEADPINLAEPDPHALPADAVEEWLSMRVSTAPPGLLSKLDLTPQKIIAYGVAITIGYSILSGVLGGGGALI